MSRPTTTSKVDRSPQPGGTDIWAPNSEAEVKQIDETRRFVERALLDFGLLEAFEHRSLRERAACLLWIAASSNSSGEEDRVSRLLDALAGGDPLVPPADLKS